MYRKKNEIQTPKHNTENMTCRYSAVNAKTPLAPHKNVGRNCHFETLSRLCHFPLRRGTQCSLSPKLYRANPNNRETHAISLGHRNPVPYLINKPQKSTMSKIHCRLFKFPCNRIVMPSHAILAR